MLFQKPVIQPLAERPGAIAAHPSEHLLFSVRHSAGTLRLAWFRQESASPPYEDLRAALMLGEIPLMQAQYSGCPTCESLLAAGYGLPRDHRELLAARAALNYPYAGLHDALERLRPLLGLLRPGVYVLTYSHYFPTDGDGRFFWDVPEGPAGYPATADLYDSDNYRVLPSYPCFFYPSQPAGAFSPQRTEEYRQMLRRGEALPPALAYAVWGYLSVLLDGHHRASACALEGARVPCLTISEPGRLWRQGVLQMVWPDGQESAAGALLPPAQQALFERQRAPQERGAPPAASRIPFCRPWPPKYAAAARRYPTCWEAGLIALYPKAELTAEGIRLLAMDEDYEDVMAAARLLRYAARQPGADKKGLALAFTERGYPSALRRAAFEVLDEIKGDPEIDDLMIEVLVCCDRKDDPIYQIANGHWD